MAVLDHRNNTTYGEDGVGKLYIATDYTGITFPEGDGSNEASAIEKLDALTFADVGFFEKFETTIKDLGEKVIQSDYCSHTDISAKSTFTGGFKVDVHEILEMSNLAQILGCKVHKDSGVETIGMKTIARTKPFHCFKFVTCPKDGKYNVFYFVKTKLSGDITIPFNNLAREDFTGVTLEFEVSQSGNTFIKKGVAA